MSQVRRRQFLIAAGALLAAPLAAEAQQAGKTPRIAYLWPGASQPLIPRMEAFRQGLRESGYVEGQNIAVEIRSAEGRSDRLPQLAAELVRLNVDVIATSGEVATRVLQQATTTIPIVSFTDDLVGTGLVASHARPGGNTTGVSILASQLNVKRLELLKEALPGVSRIAALWDPGTGDFYVRPIESAARSLGMQLQVLAVRGPDGFDGAFQAARNAHAEAVNVLASPFMASYDKTIIELAAKWRLPTIYQWRQSAEAGGFMSYGPILLDLWRQTARVVGKILKGAKPADLPVEQPTKFELVVNARTAKALGLKIPQSLLLRADQVIE